jgi:GR25 family glycosyltransferase involved in LPS biosynthesis
MIDHIYYINLKNRKNRKLLMEHQLSRLSFPYSRFSAINPSTESISKGGEYYDFYKRNKFDKAKSFIGEDKPDAKYHAGTLGCYLSHYTLLNNIADLPANNILILEDDCDLSSGQSLDSLQNALRNHAIPEDWDIIRSTWSSTPEIKKIDYCHPLSRNFKPSQTKKIIYDINQKYNNSPSSNPVIHSLYGGTHFQLINIQSVPKIIEYLDSEVVLPIDALYSTNALNVYHSSFNAQSMGMGSDINGPSMRS